MKNPFKIFAIAAALMATVALAAVGNIWLQPVLMKGGFFAGASAAAVSTNQVTRTLGASSTIDFVAGTIICTDSAGITVTGALAGDACSVGLPASPAANSTFSCYVSAADTVKVRHCPAGTAIDPASATYYVRVISAQ
jgi:hypothetical protein